MNAENAELKSENENSIELVEYDLENGLHVILKEDHFAPVVAFQAWVKVGSSEETPEEAGLAHVLEHMLFKGTDKRGVGEVARDVEGAGGDINAWTSYDETVYHLALPSSEFELGLDILSDAVQNAALDPGELANELEVIREEIKRGKDMPTLRLSEETFRLVFGKHPYSNPIIGSDESVRGFTRDNVLNFYNKWYRPSNITLVLAGDFSEDEARRLVDGMFADFSRGEKPVHGQPEIDQQSQPQAKIIADEIHQAHLALTFQACSVFDEDLPALEVISVILGQGDSSRLVHLLQRERTLINDVYVYPWAGRSSGLFLSDAALPEKNLAEVAHLMTREILRFTRETVSETELEKAKTIVESELVYHMQTMQGKARVLGYSRTLTGDSNFQLRYLDRVRRLTAADIRSSARRILRPEKLCATLLLPNNMADEWTEESLQKIVSEACVEMEPAAERTHKSDKHGIVRVTLDNGLRVLVRENHTSPLVSMQAGFLAGLRFEEEGNNGINNLIARMLTQGTEELGARELAEQIDTMAGNLSGFAGRNTLGLKGTVISRHFSKAFKLFSDCLLMPLFDGDELEKERMLVREEIRTKDDNPSRVAFDLLQRSLYHQHPFRMDPIGSDGSVAAFSREDLREYFLGMLHPERMTLAVVGDVETDQAIEAINRCFGSLNASAALPPAPLPEQAQGGIQTSKRSLPKQQTQIVIGHLGLTFDDPDRFALSVLNGMLNGQGGRLFMELRDKQSLAYSVGSFHLESIDPGYCALYIGTSPDKRKAAVEGLLEQLKRIREEKPGLEELEHAKRYLIGSHSIGMQTNSAHAASLLLNELYGVGYDAHLHYKDKISAVTADDVLSVARKIFIPETYSLVEVGPDLDSED